MTRVELRRAGEPDRAEVLAYLCRAPEFNLFQIGDILHYGIHTPAVEMHLGRVNGELAGSLLRYHDTFVFETTAPRCDWSAAAELVRLFAAERGHGCLMGRLEHVALLEGSLGPVARERTQHFAVCATPAPRIELSARERVEWATADDVGDVVALLLRIAEFNFKPESASILRRELEDGVRRIALVRDVETAAVVSAASAVAETDAAAMIVGVATDPAERHRRRGYASACCAALVEDLARRGKVACLFYDNPGAGAIYRRLGFNQCGLWRILNLR